MLEVGQPVADALDIADDVVKALGGRVGQPLVGEVGDRPEPVGKRVDEVDQATLPEGFCLDDPLDKGLLELVGVGRRGEAYMEVVAQIYQFAQQRASGECVLQPGLLGGRGLGLEQVPFNALESLDLRLLASQLASENVECFIKALDHRSGGPGESGRRRGRPGGRSAC